jgi:predicted phosphodiesterase
VTFPSADSKELSTIWVIGDAGSGKKEQNLVRDSYLSYCSNKKPDLWIWLGDNAYEKGKKEEYQQNVFTSHFEDIMKNTPVYSCIGNHDMANMGYQNFFTRIFNFHYFTVFDHPEKGEAGGVPSNSRHYYSFDYRNIHFISLDSYGSFNHSSSSMYKWLQEDLKQNNQTWTIVFFHHPPYTKGTHDSDYEQEMLDMRENILPLLEQYGVDLVLSGHSHVYERSFLINGHYGRSESFNSSMMLDKGKGSPEAPYRKEWRGKGTVYAVVGNSGKAGGRKEGWPHPAMAYYNSEAMGSMKLEVKGDSLHARFVDTEKKVRDEFVMTKRVSSIKYQNAGI